MKLCNDVVATSHTPAVLANDTDITSYLSPEGATSHTGRDIVIPTLQGSNLVVCDLCPGGQSQMHRTASIDYVVCTHGRVGLDLDGGETVELGVGVSFADLFSLGA